MNFDIAFDRLMGNEGGYSNDPNDPGGETNWGISKASYPDIDIKNLTRDGAKVIYKRDFWDRIHADQLHPALSFQAFDNAVNCGIDESVMMLQRALHVKADGEWGPVTAAAEDAMPDAKIVIALIAEEIDFKTDLRNFARYGPGWMKRAANDLRYAAADL